MKFNKNNKTMKHFFAVIVTLLTIVSCGGKQDVQYLPFLETDGGDWGLISPSGEVLFKGEFKEQPTQVSHDRFFAKNGKGKWELFAAEQKPKQVGKEEYEQAGVFVEDVAPVVRKGQHIEFIDTEGKVKFSLDKVDGKPVTECTNFSEGIAVFKAGDYYGAIDPSGKVVIKPEYVMLSKPSDARLLAISKAYETEVKELNDNNNDEVKKKIKVTVLSTDGKKISELNMAKFDDLKGFFVDGAMGASVKDNEGNESYGLIDEKGEWILKPSKKVTYISRMAGKSFIFNDGERYGLMSFEGEEIIRAKYESLIFADDDGTLLYAKKSDKDGYMLIDRNDQQVGKETFEDYWFFNGDYAPVKFTSNNWGFVNKKGEDLKVKQDIFSIAPNSGDDVFHSQYVDVQALINELQLTKNGFCGLALTSSAESNIKRLSKLSSNQFSADPYTRRYETVAQAPVCIQRIDMKLQVAYNSFYVESGEQAGSYAYSGNAAYSFSKTLHPTGLLLRIEEEGLMKDNMGKLAQALMTKVKSFGKVVKSSDKGLLVAVGSTSYLVYRKGNELTVELVDIEASKIPFDQFMREDFSSTSSQEELDVDTVAADSAFEPEPDSDIDYD